MKNAKKPPHKVSNLMKMMNYMLYTVFLFQIFIILLFASLSIVWIENRGKNYGYLNMDSDDVGASQWFINLLTYWVAYSHMIPISLYVIIEVLKLVQSYLIKWDDDMYDKHSGKQAECRNSDLIEELGQVDFIFSDKTGTLTCNKMIFKKCHIKGVNYTLDPFLVPEGQEIDEEAKSNIMNQFPNYEQMPLNTPNFENEDKGMTNLVNAHQNPDGTLKADVANNSEIKEFFQFMALCHSVMVDHDPENDDLLYQSSSPDELALIKASNEVGIKLTERTKDFMQIADDGIK